MSIGGSGGTRVAELEVLIRADGTQAQSEMNNVARTFHNLIAGGALLQAGRGVIDWFKNAITSGAAFEQTMVRIDNLTTGTAVGVDALTKKAFQVDQMTIYSAQQIAEAMEQLAREGFTGEQILGDWTDAAVNFAAVINEDLVQSANIMGQVARIFKNEGLSAAATADVLSQAILRSGRPAVEFMTGMQYIGGIASQIGVPLEEVATSLSYLQSVGIRGRSVGTGLRSMFLELAAGSDAFGMSHGVQAFDPVTGAFVGMPKIIDQFHQLIQGMTKAEGLQFIADIFGKPAASPLYQLFADGVEAYEEHNEKMESLGSAATFMKKLMDTIAGSLDRFQAATSNFARSIGVIAGNILKPIIDILTAFFGALTDLPEIVKVAGVALVGLTGILMMLAGAFMIFKGLGGFLMLLTMLKTMAVISIAAAGAIAVLVGAFILFRNKIGGWIDGVKEALGPLGTIFDYLSAITQGKNPVKEFLGGMEDGPLRTFAIGAGRVVEALADLWFFISKGDWDRFFRRLPGELRQMAGGFDLIFDAIGDIDWSTRIMSALGWVGNNIVLPALTAIVNLSLDLLTNFGEGIDSAFGWIGEKLGIPTTGAWEEHTNPVTIIITGQAKLGGALWSLAGNLAGGLAAMIRGGGEWGRTGAATIHGDATGGPEMDSMYDVDLGTVTLMGSPTLAKAFLAGKSLGTWIADTLTGAVPVVARMPLLQLEVVDVLLSGTDADTGNSIYDNIVNSLANGIRDFSGGVTNLAEAIGSLIWDGITEIASWSPDQLAAIGGDAGLNLGAAIHDVLVGAVKTVVTAPVKLAVALAELVVGALGAIDNETLTTAGNAAANLATGFSAALGGFLVGLITGWDGEEPFPEFADQLTENISTTIDNAILAVVDFLGEQKMGLTAIEGIVQWFWNMFSQKFQESSVDFLNNTLLNNIVNNIAKAMNWLLPDVFNIEIPEVEFYIDGDGNIAIREKASSDGESAAQGYIGSYEEAMLDWIFNNPIMLPPPIMQKGTPEHQNMFKPKPGPYGNMFVEHSPGEGYAIPQGPSYNPNSPFNLPPVEGMGRVLEVRDALTEINSTNYKVTVDAEVDEKVDRLVEILGGTVSDTAKAAKLDLDVGGAAQRFTDAFSWGEVWAGTTFTSTFDIFNGPAAVKYTDAFTWGDIWGMQTFISTFDINHGPAAIKYTDAFGWGETWAAQTFTARFSVDLSPLEAAANRAITLAQIISDHMPRSPAKKGPLKDPISFQYIADDFNSVADSIAARARDSAGLIAGAMTGPRQASTPDVTLPASRSVNNYFFALTGEDLTRLQQQAQSGSLNLAEADRELRLSLGMV